MERKGERKGEREREYEGHVTLVLLLQMGSMLFPPATVTNHPQGILVRLHVYNRKLPITLHSEADHHLI